MPPHFCMCTLCRSIQLSTHAQPSRPLNAMCKMKKKIINAIFAVCSAALHRRRDRDVLFGHCLIFWCHIVIQISSTFVHMEWCFHDYILYTCVNVCYMVLFFFSFFLICVFWRAFQLRFILVNFSHMRLECERKIGIFIFIYLFFVLFWSCLHNHFFLNPSDGKLKSSRVMAIQEAQQFHIPM